MTGRAAGEVDRRSGLHHVVRARSEGGGFVLHEDTDHAAAEEPLEVRIEHAGENHQIAVTMRTPGDDVALVAGFLFTEGIIDGALDLIEVRPCKVEDTDGVPVENVVQALLRPDMSFSVERFRRNVYTTSSCGVCGKASIDAVAVHCDSLPPPRAFITAGLLATLPERLAASQEVFGTTGGLHATALVDRDGNLEDVREDVGRHNAMDKVVGGALLQERLPLHDRLLLVSGRASFELVQKAARAGVPILAAIGAPSTLAIEAADRLGLTLIGFLSGHRFNVYTHPVRVAAQVTDRPGVDRDVPAAPDAPEGTTGSPGDRSPHHLS